MAFKKMEVGKLPARQWSLVGDPNTGKSTFAAQMKAPMLVVDSDHRFEEVAANVAGSVFELSDNPADNIDASKIYELIKENMAGSGVKTIIVDSLTSIITPLVVEAMLDNELDSNERKNKNRVASFKPKALALRLIQDAVTGTGADTLFIYHTRSGLDAQAAQKESTSISAVELARLRRSLNMSLRVITKGDMRGIRVDWARRGRSGIELWDETGKWIGMCEKIEKAVYGGLSTSDMNNIETGTPTKFANPADAIAWAFEQGCFRDAVHAQNAYDKCKEDVKPTSAAAMWSAWIAEVGKRVAEKNAPPADADPELWQTESELVMA